MFQGRIYNGKLILLVEAPIDMEEDDKEEVDSLPKKKKKSKQSASKKDITSIRNFRPSRLPNFHGLKLGVLAIVETLHMICCRVCTTFKKKSYLMALKSNTLFNCKHDRKKTTKKDMPVHKVKKGESYIATNCRMNLHLYGVCPPTMLLEAISNYTIVEATRKQVQFAILFQILIGGQPMVEFEG